VVVNPFLREGDDAAKLLSEELIAPPYLVDRILHAGTDTDGGTIAFLAGNPGVGKTYSGCHLLASVSQGEPWFGFETRLGPCGGIFLETPRWMLRERLLAITGDRLPPGRLFVRTASDLGRDSIDVCDPVQQAQIVEWARDRELTLIVIDPFAFVHGLEEKETSDAIRIGDALKGIAREARVALVIVDHFRKMASGGSREEVVQALRGAIAKSAWAGAVRLRFGKVAGGMPPDPVYLVRDPGSGVLTVTAAPKSQTDMQGERVRILRELMSDGQTRTVKEMADVLTKEGLSTKADTVRRKYVAPIGLERVGGSKNSAYRFPDASRGPHSVRESTQSNGQS
jgi:hypothetical protein